MNIQKRYLSALLLGFMLYFASITISSADNRDKVVLHINTPTKMTMLVNNVINLRHVLGKDADIRVVVNGPAVARFTTLSESRNQLDQILQQNASVAVCSYALKNKKISKELLYEGTQYLEDGGVANLVKLQQQGYAYIKP